MAKILLHGLKWIVAVYIVSIILTVLMLALVSAIDMLNVFAIQDFFIIIFSLIGSLVVIVGIYKPSVFVYKAIIGLSALDIIFSVLYIFIRPLTFLVIINILGLLVTVLILWYIIKVKTYFTGPTFNLEDKTFLKVDKKFRLVFSVLIVLMIAALVIDTGLTATDTDVKQGLLEKPLEQYAPTLGDLGTGFKINEPMIKHMTRSEMLELDLNESDKTALLDGLQEIYTVWFDSDEKVVQPNITLVYTLYKFADVNGAKNNFAESKIEIEEDSKKQEKEYDGIEATALSVSRGNESFAWKNKDLLVSRSYYTVLFRTKNITHEIFLLDYTNTFSTEDILIYINKVIDKTIAKTE